LAWGIPRFVRGAAEDIHPAGDWASVRGVNFFPGYARNAYETWAKYDARDTAKTLRMIRGIGFNSVRIWLHSDAYFEDPAKFLASVRDCLDACARLELTAMPVLFDACGVEPRADARSVPMREVYDSLLLSPAGTPEVRESLIRYGKGIARQLAPDTPVPWPSDPSVLFWEWWRPNPGASRCGPEHYERLEQYARAVLEEFDRHPAVLIWDIHNEPPVAEPFTSFVRHMCGVADALALTKPTTIGAAGTEATEAFADVVPVLSFHTYHTGEALRADFDAARRISRRHGDKPMLLTECLANVVFQPPARADLARDDGQLAHYRAVLPEILAGGFGWYSWGGVVGNLFASSCDIVYPNGYKRPAGAYLQAMLAGDTAMADRFQPRVTGAPPEFGSGVLVSPLPLVDQGTTHWDRLHGVNFIPSYARTAIESWRNYDAAVVDRELGFARSLGFNAVRAWLHEQAYLAGPDQFLADLDDFVARCARHDLYVIVVLFDQCGSHYDLAAATPISLGDKVASHGARPGEAEFVDQLTRRGTEAGQTLLAITRDMLLPHPSSPVTLWTQWWYPNPAPDELGDDAWPRMERYARAVADRIGANPRIIAWDALNEPGGHVGYQAFARRAARCLRELQVAAPVTIGVADFQDVPLFVDDVDLLSFHTYEQDQALASRLAEAKRYAAQVGKEIIVTECLSNFPTPDWYDGTDWGQLAHYQRNLPILAEGGIGWTSWGLVCGNLFETFTGLMYQTGFRRPAANFVAGSLGGFVDPD